MGFPGRALRAGSVAGGVKVDGAHGDNGGNGVLVNHLLFAVAVEHDDKAVVTADHAVHLEAVHQKNGDQGTGAAGFGQKGVLKIAGCFLQIALSPFAAKGLVYVQAMCVCAFLARQAYPNPWAERISVES